MKKYGFKVGDWVTWTGRKGPCEKLRNGKFKIYRIYDKKLYLIVNGEEYKEDYFTIVEAKLAPNNEGF